MSRNSSSGGCFTLVSRKKYFKHKPDGCYPKIDQMHPLQATSKRESLDRQFAEKAAAIQRLRESYNTSRPADLPPWE